MEKILKDTIYIFAVATLVLLGAYLLYFLGRFISFKKETKEDISGYLTDKYSGEFQYIRGENSLFEHRYYFRTGSGTDFLVTSELTNLTVPYTTFSCLYMNERSDDLYEVVKKQVINADMTYDISNLSKEEIIALFKNINIEFKEALESNGAGNQKAIFSLNLRKNDNKQTVTYMEGEDDIALLSQIQTVFT